MLWINFLHLYQPANSESSHIKKATEKSYWRIIRALEEHPNIRFTLNISGCLILRWEELGYFDLIKRLAKLVESGRIELVGSAAYHPLLPLIPEKEAVRQIKENEKILEKYFRKKLKGFFSPEMAYSPEVAKIVKSLGYKWMILDEIALKGKNVNANNIYEDKNSGLKIILRSKKLSQTYLPDTLNKYLKLAVQNKERIAITATDAELYGLRHEDPTGEFEKLLSSPSLDTLTISEFIKDKPVIKSDFLNSSWETNSEDIKKKRPYSLWADKKNILQVKLWQLANLAQKTSESNKGDKQYYWSRWHLVRGLASCTFWWASGKDMRKVFGPITWNPDQIEKGVNDLVRAIRSLDNINNRQVKLKAEKMQAEIRKMIWETHWKKHWKKV